MKRRTALGNVAVGLGSLLTLPGWATGWSADRLPATNVALNPDALLADIVDTIIPETSTPNVASGATSNRVLPGAKALGVHQFVALIVQDCYPESARATFQQGLAQVERLAQQTHGRAFSACDAGQRQNVLTQMGSPLELPGAEFMKMVKGLAVQGYLSSEYYQTNVANYVMAPGYYHGCVSVASLAQR